MANGRTIGGGRLSSPGEGFDVLCRIQSVSSSVQKKDVVDIVLLTLRYWMGNDIRALVVGALDVLPGLIPRVNPATDHNLDFSLRPLKL